MDPFRHHLIRRARTSVVVLVLLFGHPSALAQTASPPVAAEFQALLDAAVNERQVFGIAAGVMVNGNLLWAGGAGFADAGSQRPFGPTTVTRIASISKPMTAVAIMQRVEEGAVDLDIPIQTYVPSFPKKRQGDVTVRHLLAHTAGIPGYTSAKESENRRQYDRLADAAKVFQKRKLLSKPGTAYHYTSYGYVLLGLVLEQVSGLDYTAAMRAQFWDKLGMGSTGPESPRPEKSALFHRLQNGDIRQAAPTNLSDRVPGGGLQSNVLDVLAFGDAVARGLLIRPETLRTMLEDPGEPPLGNRYGLGWHLYGTDPWLGPVFGHPGTQTGASAMLLVVPQKKLAVVVLSNTSGSLPRVQDVSRRLMEIAAEIR